jgi:hypothetical protein
LRLFKQGDEDGGCHAKEMKQRCMGCRILDGDEEGAPFVADRNSRDKGRWSRVVTGDLVGGRSITGGWFSDRKPTRAGEGDDVVVPRRSPARMWLLHGVAGERDRGTSRWPVLLVVSGEWSESSRRPTKGMGVLSRTVVVGMYRNSEEWGWLGIT